jgi:hypothetical protein
LPVNRPGLHGVARATSRWREPGVVLTALVLACSAALLAPLVRPMWSTRIFVYNDLLWFHLPMRYLYQQALRAGDSLLWTPAVFSGFYLHGEGQTGVFHPLHLLLYGFLRLEKAFGLELLFNYVAAFAGMVWFLHRLRCSPVAACTGAMLFAFSGFSLLHFHHLNMVAVVAHLPWLLAAADVVIADDRPRARRWAFGALAALIASGFLVGFPQSMWWDALALAGFATLRAGETGRWRALIPCAAAVAIGVLLGGIQIVPTADAAARSMRADLSREFALTYSLHPVNLFQLWSPHALSGGAYTALDFMWLHEFGIYSGALLPVALAWVWIRRAAMPGRRALIASATAFAAVALVLALGRYGGVDPLLTYLPVLGSFRAPTRYIVLAQFALAILAALTVDDLLAIVEGRAQGPAGLLPALWIPAALGLATTVVLNGRLMSFTPQVFAPVATAAPGVAVVALVTLLVFLAGRGRGRLAAVALAALIVVTAADLGAYGIGFIRGEPPRPIIALIGPILRAPSAPEEAYAAVSDEGPFRSNLLVLQGYRLTTGYAGLFPGSRHPLGSDEALRLSGTRWLFTTEGARLPFAGGVPRVRLLDEGGQPASGVVRLAIDRPGRLVVHVEAPGRRIVALTERFHDGWTAKSGGTAVPTVRVDSDFLGCVVEPGTHRLVLRFMPWSFVIGSIVSAIGALLWAGVLLWWPARP